MPRKIIVSAEQRKKLIRHIEDRWFNDNSDWLPWYSKLSKYRRAYLGILPAKTQPWKGSSNLHIPITTVSTEEMHTGLMGLVDQGNNLVTMVPTEAGDVGRVKGVEVFCNHALYRQMKVHPKLDRLAHKTVMYGRCPALVLWVRKRRRVRECWPVPISELGGRKDPVTVAQYHFKDQFTEVSRFDKDRSVAFVKYEDRGTRREATVTVLRDVDRSYPVDDEIEYEVDQWDTVYNAPSLEIPDIGDVLVSADGITPAESSMKYYNEWPNLADVLEKADAGFWTISNKLRSQLLKAHRAQDTADQSFRSEQNTTVSRQAPDVESARRRYRYHIQKIFLDYDLDRDGHPEKIIVTTLIDQGTKRHLLRVDYHESIFPHGKEAIINSDFIFVDEEPTCLGVPAFVAALQAEANTLWNQTNDRNSILTNPWFLYRTGSTLTPQIYNLKPGEGVPVDDPSSVVFPRMPVSTAADSANFGQIMAFAQRMIPSSDVQRGNLPNRATASGMAMALQQGQQAIGKFLRRFGWTLEDIVDSSMQLYGAFGDPELEFRVSGTQEIHNMSRNDLRQGYDVQIITSALLANKELVRSAAFMRYQLFQQNPILQSLAVQRQLVEDVLEATDYKAPAKITGHLPAESASGPRTPEQETVMLVQGIPWPPRADDNHEIHIEGHMQSLQTPYAQLPGAAELITEHIEHHKRLQSTQAAAAQQGGQQEGVPLDGQDPLATADAGRQNELSGIVGGESGGQF